jgi:DNA mismatch endonuclease, patch repair protein
MDIVTPAKRSLMMSGIRGKNTKPELAVRKLVHGLGYWFRLHRRDLPGSPDLALPRLKKVIFVHGCFWHRHQGCKFACTPKSNVEFWQTKLNENIRRDTTARHALCSTGWEVLIVWECEVSNLPALSQKLSTFLSTDAEGSSIQVPLTRHESDYV